MRAYKQLVNAEYAVPNRGGSRIRPLGGLRGAVREREITYVRESCWQQAQVGQLGLLLLLY